MCAQHIAATYVPVIAAAVCRMSAARRGWNGDDTSKSHHVGLVTLC
jgi:hypothetical protein